MDNLLVQMQWTCCAEYQGIPEDVLHNTYIPGLTSLQLPQSTNHLRSTRYLYCIKDYIFYFYFVESWKIGLNYFIY